MNELEEEKQLIEKYEYKKEINGNETLKLHHTYTVLPWLQRQEGL